MNDDKCLHNLSRLHGKRHRFEADQFKESFKNFFIGRDSEVIWQYKHVRFCATVHDQENIQNTTSKASYRNTEYPMQKLHFTVIVCLLSLRVEESFCFHITYLIENNPKTITVK